MKKKELKKQIRHLEIELDELRESHRDIDEGYVALQALVEKLQLSEQSLNCEIAAYRVSPCSSMRHTDTIARLIAYCLQDSRDRGCRRDLICAVVQDLTGVSPEMAETIFKKALNTC